MELGSYMQTGSKNRKEERRSGVDRRMDAIGLDFPFIDSHGNLVTEDRRKTTRRRQNKSGSSNSSHDQQQKTYA